MSVKVGKTQGREVLTAYGRRSSCYVGGEYKLWLLCEVLSYPKGENIHEFVPETQSLISVETIT